MSKVVTKSQFNLYVSEYFRKIERTGEEVVITSQGKPVLKIVPYSVKPADSLKALRGSVVKYDETTKQSGEKWEGLRQSCWTSWIKLGGSVRRVTKGHRSCRQRSVCS